MEISGGALAPRVAGIVEVGTDDKPMGSEYFPVVFFSPTGSRGFFFECVPPSPQKLSSFRAFQSPVGLAPTVAAVIALAGVVVVVIMAFGSSGGAGAYTIIGQHRRRVNIRNRSRALSVFSLVIKTLTASSSSASRSLSPREASNLPLRDVKSFLLLENPRRAMARASSEADTTEACVKRQKG